MDNRSLSCKLVMVLIALSLLGCQGGGRQMPDPGSGYAALRQDLEQEQRQLRRVRQEEQATLAHDGPAPEAKNALSPVAPEFNPLQETQVSIAVNNRPLHDILYVIARDAGLNLVIAPGISLENRVTISFEQAPGNVVVDKLLRAYDLAWRVKDNVLAVEPFEEQLFSLDFLNSNTKVAIDSGGDIFGNANAEGGAQNLTGNFGISSSYGQGGGGETLYGFLESSLQKLLAAGDQQASQGHFVLDPTAGTLYVRASPRKMDVVQQFVNRLKAKLARQVVIDAQILEVILDDSFQFGVDWNYIASHLIRGTSWDINVGWDPDEGFGSFEPGSGPHSIVISDGPGASDGFSGTIQALETFGAVHVVSNPHIRTKHSQPALVTSGTTQNYVKEIKREEDDDNNTTSVSTDTATAFEGVMLGVVPFITDSQAVDLSVFPITSQVDLSNTVNIGQDQITLPKVDVRNVNTSVRVQDGDTVILGGLIQRDKKNNDRGTPGISKVPVLGWLFKRRVDSHQLSELVVVMHVRVI